MTDIVVCIVRVPKARYHFARGYDAADFGRLINEASSFMGRLKRQGDGLRMFVAPEYFFSPVGVIGQHQPQQGPQPMERSDKHELYDELKKISGQAGETIIVAGSIFYRKMKGTAARGLNVCPILRKGKIIHKYYKRFNDGMLGKSDPRAHFEFKSTDPYFEVAGVRFGIEICADHSNDGNNLNSWLATNPHTIDVQVLISDGMFPVVPFMVARTGGYFIQCDLNGEAGAAVRVYTTNSTWQIAARTCLDPRIIVDSLLPGLELNFYLLTNV